MRYLSIKNLKKHQHYKDRRPPWIKLHAEVLDDYAFTCLQDASKAHLMLLWVLASRMDNRIPYDLAWITQKLGANTAVDLEELVLQGFIEVSQDDSTTLAPRKQSAMPETETEGETEKRNSMAVAVAPASRKAKGVTPPASPPAKPRGGLGVLPKDLCDGAWKFWGATIGGVDYGRFRKALLPVFQTAERPPTLEDLTNTITVFDELRAAEDPKWRTKYTVESWAGQYADLLRLAALPLVDEWGMFTERGIAAGLAKGAA